MQEQKLGTSNPEVPAPQGHQDKCHEQETSKVYYRALVARSPSS